MYIFDKVYFHDTDNIKLIIKAAGYQSLEVNRTFFTSNDMDASVALNPVP